MKSIDRIVRKVDLPIKWIIFVMTAVLNLLPFVWGFITSFKSTPRHQCISSNILWIFLFFGTLQNSIGQQFSHSLNQQYLV